jgi:hypothetical protein
MLFDRSSKSQEHTKITGGYIFCVDRLRYDACGLNNFLGLSASSDIPGSDRVAIDLFLSPLHAVSRAVSMHLPSLSHVMPQETLVDETCIEL